MPGLADHVDRNHLSDALARRGFGNDLDPVSSRSNGLVGVVAKGPYHGVLSGSVSSTAARGEDFLTICSEDAN